LGNLLARLPHFNYRGDLLRAVTGLLVDLDGSVGEIALGSLSTLIRENREPEATAEAAQLIADLLRRHLSKPKPFKREGKWITPKGVRFLPPAALALLAEVRYTDLERERSRDVGSGASGADGDGAGGDGKKAGESTTKRGKKREARKRKRDDVDAAFAAARATDDPDAARRAQSRAFETMFESYFRVIKAAAGAPRHRTMREEAAGLRGGERFGGSAGGLSDADLAARAARRAEIGTIRPEDDDEDDASDASGASEDDKGGGNRDRAGSAARAAARAAARRLTPEQRLACPLLPVALAGLGRHAHLIGVEYLSDLSSTLSRLASSNAMRLDPYARVDLLRAVHGILSSHLDSLRVDRAEFFFDLYDVLLGAPEWGDGLVSGPLPDGVESFGIEGEGEGKDHDGDGDGNGDDPAAADARAAAEAVGLAEGDTAARAARALAAVAASRAARSAAARAADARAIASRGADAVAALQAWLLEGRPGDHARLAAFLKRCLGAALVARPGLAMGLLGIVKGLLKRHGRLRLMLDADGDGPGGDGGGGLGGMDHDASGGAGVGGAPVGLGGWRPDDPDPGAAGALRCPAWELSLLGRHWHPYVAGMARSLASLDVATGGFAAGSDGGAPGGGGVPGGGGDEGGGAAAPYLNPALTPEDLARIHGAEAAGGLRPGPRRPEASSTAPAGQVRRRRRARAGAARLSPSCLALLPAAIVARRVAAAGGMRKRPEATLADLVSDSPRPPRGRLATHLRLRSLEAEEGRLSRAIFRDRLLATRLRSRLAARGDADADSDGEGKGGDRARAGGRGGDEGRGWARAG